jgi:hypothetical protein
MGSIIVMIAHCFIIKSFWLKCVFLGNMTYYDE